MEKDQEAAWTIPNNKSLVPLESNPSRAVEIGYSEHKRIHGRPHQRLPSCSLCGKQLPSWKSLFRHMRNHPLPLRACRGVSLPSSQETGTASPPPNLAASLGGWSVTAKRGRCSLAAACNHHRKIKEAVGAPPPLQSPTQQQPPAAEGQSQPPVAPTSDGVTQNAKKRRLNHKAGDVFECDICGRAFPTHQALGGHKAAHKYKFRKEYYSTRVSDSWANSGADDHVCNICGLGFPTGQALGGHKRRHWTGPPSSPPSSRKLLDFDLNELPSLTYDQPCLPVCNSAATCAAQ